MSGPGSCLVMFVLPEVGTQGWRPSVLQGQGKEG